VKEKFGTLSFYMTSTSPKIQGIIRGFSFASAHVCELCGNEKARRCLTGPSKAWVKTYCEECEEKEAQRIEREKEEWRRRQEEKKCGPKGKG
jgi:hypothetical protein